MSKVVLSELKNGIRTITLNRPEKLNAMNRELIRATGAAFSEANGDNETKVVVFRGAGRAFCAGDDLTQHRESPVESEVRDEIEALQAVTREIVMGGKVVIGAIHGWAVGGGFEWAIDCDLPIWGRSARAFFPELEWGMFVTGGLTTILPRIIGLVRAKEMILLGQRYSAEQLLEMGIAWRVVPDDELFAEAEAVAARIAALPATAVADFKHVIARACYMDVESAMALESEATVRAFMDPETTARVKEFARR